MKVHPAPKKRNITLRYGIISSQKKLRRLPHIFEKVLELPFHSDADVSVEETAKCFRFIVDTEDITGEIRTDTIEIYPGVTKIVVKGENVVDLSKSELELDVWRFRLPQSTKPELASAAFSDGELVVTVPKDYAQFTGDEVWGESERGQLLIVH